MCALDASLADEMGLGKVSRVSSLHSENQRYDKTLQVIAFNAHLRELGHFRPFLIVCPLSVIHNWVDEFRRFTPTVGFHFIKYVP